MGTVFAKSVERKDTKSNLNLDGIDVRVDQVFVDGLARTKNDIIGQFVQELFKAKNFAEMLEKSHVVKNKLEDSGCFAGVDIQLDTSTGPSATPDCGYVVTFVVKELRPFVGGISTMVGTNNEGMLVVTGKVSNAAGRGERILGQFSYGNKQTRDFHLTFSKPLFTRFNANVATTLFSLEQEWPMSKYKLHEYVSLLDFSFFSMNNLKHSLQWEGALRDMKVGNRYAAFEVRENAGSSMKSSVKHILSYDTRKTVIFPTSGVLSKLTSEYAGLGGNVAFLKHDGQLEINVPLLEDCVLQGSLAGGCILPLQNTKSKGFAMCDNFFLGGPIAFRGFELRGAGPSSDGCFTGGKMYWNAGISLFTPLPFRPSVKGFGEYFRAHFFANVGNIGEFDKAEGLQGLMNQARFAYGLGLALRIANMARLEINYCLPTWVQAGDRPVHGIQIGITSAQ